ncbi:MAG: FAD-dependent oxidoreductase, partial [Pyrinomonadaceae bacterium]|nr:FAD-dependent oxidoreductase [Pyrinomonadaceae bacterium]
RNSSAASDVYKRQQRTSLEEVREAEKLGVHFVTNAVVGSEGLQFSDIREQHDAVFIATGLGSTNRLNIPGEDLLGVIDALTFIERVKSREWHSVPLGRSIAVIGAGNTAIDAVTQAKRMGAENVMLIYRRTENEAPAYDYEKELAKKDGIRFYWQTTPLEIIGNANVEAMRCKAADGFVFDIACDQVIKAIGQVKTGSFFTDVCGVAVDKKGRVAVNEIMQTSDPKIFAGGDCVNGGGEAVEAAQMGKIAAQGIHLSLTGETVSFAGAI